MEKSTHTERVAVALAMRAACAAEIERYAPPVQAEGYQREKDSLRLMADRIRRIDPVDTLPTEMQLAEKLSDKEAFEKAAKIENFPIAKKDDGSYFHPITIRAWKLWQMAMQHKTP